MLHARDQVLPAKLMLVKASDLAEFLDLSLPTIGAIRNGRSKLSAKHAQMLSQELKIPLCDILPETYPQRIFGDVIYSDES